LTSGMIITAIRVACRKVATGAEFLDW